MEQAVIRTGRRTGWSENENKLLWETADEAQQQGLPLKSVFEEIAQRTGRRPNSIRNYYYAQVRTREDGANHAARFVPFTQSEVDWLMEQVLTARAEGQSVRSCLQKLSGGDHSLMLRYQNKYRAIIKSRPDYVREVVEKLNGAGVMCDAPQVNHRVRCDLNAACADMTEEAQRADDAELAHACETLTRYLRKQRVSDAAEDLRDASQSFVDGVKELLALPDSDHDAFRSAVAAHIGAIEAALTRMQEV